MLLTNNSNYVGDPLGPYWWRNREWCERAASLESGSVISFRLGWISKRREQLPHECWTASYAPPRRFRS
jgi:hypothetical protein